MPRSGTTHLVNLLAADRRRRALPYWESQEPIPARGRGPDVFGVDPRYGRARAEHDAMLANMPLVAAMHDQFPEAIEEEVELLDLDPLRAAPNLATFARMTPLLAGGERAMLTVEYQGSAEEARAGLGRLRAHGFRSGLVPERPGAGEMHALVPMLMSAFSVRE